MAAATAKPLELQWRMKLDNINQGMMQPFYWLSYLIFWARDAYDAKRRRWRWPLPPRVVNYTCGEGDAPALMTREALHNMGISNYICWSRWSVNGPSYERDCQAVVPARMYNLAVRNMRLVEQHRPVARRLHGVAPSVKSPAEWMTRTIGALLRFDYRVPKAPRRRDGKPGGIGDIPLPW